MRRIILTAVSAALVSAASAAAAQIFVNGAALNPTQAALLARISCGPIPSGSYWLDTDSGIWGYWGNPQPMGHIRDRCGDGLPREGAGGARPGLSQRGLLFRPGEILNGG